MLFRVFRLLQQPHPTKIFYLLISYFVDPRFMCKISKSTFSPKDNENDESDLIYFISIGWPNTQFRNLSVKWPKKYHFETKLVWVDLKSSKVRISSNLIIFYQYNIHNLESFFFLNLIEVYSGQPRLGSK